MEFMQFWENGTGDICFQIQIKPQHLLNLMKKFDEADPPCEICVVYSTTVQCSCDYEEGLVGISIEPYKGDLENEKQKQDWKEMIQEILAK